MTEIMAYTDGSCKGDGSYGGMGVYVVVDGCEEVTLRRGYLNTTTPRMEMRALLEAVRMVNPLLPVKLTVCVDSQFVANAFLKGWLSKWRMAGYTGVANADLWRAIVREIDSRRLMRFNVRWVRGHGKDLNDDNVYGNSIADRLADCNTQDSYVKDFEEKFL